MSASSLWQRGSIAAVVTTALLVTGCGSSSSGAAAAGGSSTAPAAATGSAGSAPTSAAGGAPQTSGKIVIPSEAGVTSVKATGGGAFCKDLAAAINHAATSTATTPAELKASIQKSLAVSVEALSKAPSAIKPAVTILLDATSKFYVALQKANYDFTKLTPADEAAFSTPAVEAASTQVNDYVKTNCGIDLGAGAAASSS